MVRRPTPVLSGSATAANARRNAAASPDRTTRWRPARDACFAFLDAAVREGGAVAIVGAGNADDVPLTRIAARAGRVDLIDVDLPAVRMAIRSEPRALRRRLRAIEQDATRGAADRVVAAAAVGRVPDAPAPSPTEALGEGDYDLVVGDLLYSQLLYPGLVDLELDEARVGSILASHGPPLTRDVVARLHASAPRGTVVHLHDPIAWWQGHEQPFPLSAVLERAASDAGAALALIGTGKGPTGTDPRAALAGLGIAVRRTALWHWPFAPGVDYLVCASEAG